MASTTRLNGARPRLHGRACPARARAPRQPTGVGYSCSNAMRVAGRAAYLYLRINRTLHDNRQPAPAISAAIAVSKPRFRAGVVHHLPKDGALPCCLRSRRCSRATTLADRRAERQRLAVSYDDMRPGAGVDVAVDPSSVPTTRAGPRRARPFKIDLVIPGWRRSSESPPSRPAAPSRLLLPRAPASPRSRMRSFGTMTRITGHYTKPPFPDLQRRPVGGSLRTSGSSRFATQVQSSCRRSSSAISNCSRSC